MGVKEITQRSKKHAHHHPSVILNDVKDLAVRALQDR
jgi:hypothetical protein